MNGTRHGIDRHALARVTSPIGDVTRAQFLQKAIPTATSRCGLRAGGPELSALLEHFSLKLFP
jgi:hypothetical protein